MGWLGEYKKTLCYGCPRRCCTDIKIDLTEAEVQKLRTLGAIIKPVDYFFNDLLGRGHCDKYLVTKCPYLQPDGSCKVWGTEDQPGACRLFIAGGFACLDRRGERCKM